MLSDIYELREMSLMILLLPYPPVYASFAMLSMTCYNNVLQTIYTKGGALLNKLRIAAFAALLAMCVLSLLGCGETGSISGVVTVTSDSGTTKLAVSPRLSVQYHSVPLEGAIIEVEGVNQTVVTGPDGRFSVTGIPAGYRWVKISHRAIRDSAKLQVDVAAYKDTPLGTETSVMGRGFYLFVGINNYQNSRFNLKGPVTDVQTLNAAVNKNGLMTKTTTLLSEEATKDNIKKAIQDIEGEMQPQDYFVFYFSGHGGRSDFFGNTEYISTYGLSLGDKSTIITDGELADWLAPIAKWSGSVTVILDSCNSGAFVNGVETRSISKVSVPPPPSTIVMKALRKPGYVVLAASSQDELSWEYWGRGAFTAGIVKGLDTGKTVADINRDGQITTRELYNYIMTVVPDEVYQVTGAQQTPVMWPDPALPQYRTYQGPPVLKYSLGG
jgi:hypothetical protein